MDMFKYWFVWTVCRRGLQGLIVALFLYASYSVGRYLHPVTAFADRTIDNSEISFKAKIEALKDGVVKQLAACENTGYTENGVQIIWDTNNKASIGSLMFQIDTVRYYYKLMTGKEISKKDAVILALDEARARELAKWVMFETKNMAGKDWVNCDKKLKLDQQIILIKGLLR
jgi:hypothetical protein